MLILSSQKSVQQHILKHKCCVFVQVKALLFACAVIMLVFAHGTVYVSMLGKFGWSRGGGYHLGVSQSNTLHCYNGLGASKAEAGGLMEKSKCHFGVHLGCEKTKS